eukprot:gene10875-12671_t
MFLSTRLKFTKSLTHGDIELNLIESSVLAAFSEYYKSITITPGYYLIALLKDTIGKDSVDIMEHEMALKNHMQDHHHYLSPIKIAVTDKLPLHPSGKLLYREVLQMFGDYKI